MNKKVAIIGAGPMGMTCAYELLKKGYKVDVYEKENVAGGMSAHFDFSGLSIEKYYHFVCGPDDYTFSLMKELGIFEQLKWTETKMGLYYEGKLYPWGGPFELLRFPQANLIEKAGYGAHVFLSSKRKNWHKLDDITAIEWIKRWVGDKGYQKFWDSLFELKFYERKTQIAAPWLWSRLVRVAKSRKNIFTERMGYISGGSDGIIQKLMDRISALGGQVHLGKSVEKVNFEGDQVKGISVGQKAMNFDYVISTMPIQYLSAVAEDLPPEDLDKLNGLDNVGVVCVIIKLKEAFTRNFWLNITDSDIAIPGMIELSNLNTELGENILYVPFYLHKDDPKYSNSDAMFIEEVKGYMKKIRPELDESAIKDVRVFKYEYAQPVCTPHFLSKLPSMTSDKRKGFYIADTAYCYPEDRSINESVKIAKELCEAVKKRDKA